MSVTSKASFASITHMMLTGDKKTLEVLNPTKDTQYLAQQMAASALPTFLQKTLHAADTAKLHSVLTTHFSHIQQSPLASDFSFSYTIYQPDSALDVSVHLHKKPVTAEDFYELAMAIETDAFGKDAITVAGEPADAATRHLFQYSLLQDAALTGYEIAKQQLAKLAPEKLCCSRFDFLYSYKEDVLLFLPRKVETPEEFYQLALTMADRSDARVLPPIYICQHNGTTQANPAALKVLQFSLFNDAAKAGHANANDAIIDAVIQRNDQDAKKYFSLEKFNVLGYNMYLPRKFHTADDYYLLGMALIIRKDSVHGQRVRGHFFEIEIDGSCAERLGRRLVELATAMRKNSDAERVKASYDAISRVASALKTEKLAAADLQAHVCDARHYPDNKSAFFNKKFIIPYAEIAAQLDAELETTPRP